MLCSAPGSKLASKKESHFLLLPTQKEEAKALRVQWELGTWGATEGRPGQLDIVKQFPQMSTSGTPLLQSESDSLAVEHTLYVSCSTSRLWFHCSLLTPPQHRDTMPCFHMQACAKHCEATHGTRAGITQNHAGLPPQLSEHLHGALTHGHGCCCCTHGQS